MDWKQMVNKEVFCKTKDSGVCSGIITNFDEDSKMYSLIDKYGDTWFISVDNIQKLKEEKLKEIDSQNLKNLVKPLGKTKTEFNT
jgi:hypothetical protein